MEHPSKSNQSTDHNVAPSISPSIFRTLMWAAVAVLAFFAATSTSAWAETNVPPDQIGGTVPPGQCQGALVARPDIAGTTISNSVTLLPLENDKKTPQKKGPKQGPGDVTDSQSLTVTAVATPTHGIVDWAQEETTATVIYTPDGAFTGADVFTYTVADDCGRSATGRIVVVVFRNDMPSQPAILRRPVGPGHDVTQHLTLPVSATLTIPGEVFSTTVETDAHFFVVNDLGQPEDAVDGAPGPGKDFANVAFGIAEYRNGDEVDSPVYDVPLILEIAFDLDEGQVPELFYWDEETNTWRSDGIERLSFDPETGIGTFAIYHLTDFAIFSSSGQQLLYLPNLSADN